MTTTQTKLRKAAKIAEDGGQDALAFALTKLSRAVNAAKQTEIKLDSWDDFAAWWNANRAPGLIYSLIDALGPEHPAIKQLQVINKKQDHVEKELHATYMLLKGDSDTPTAPPEPQEGEEPPEPDEDEEPPEPKDEDEDEKKEKGGPPAPPKPPPPPPK